jgi:hypothetical protein
VVLGKAIGGNILKTFSGALLILLVSTGALFAAPAPPEAKNLPAHCDKACLTDAVNSYLAALVAHDPSQVPLSAHIEFVENTVDMHPGEGLWKTASAPPTTFKIYVSDPVSQEVGFFGVMQASGKPVILALRLKIRGGQIVAAEHLIAPIRPESLKNLQTPRKVFLTPVPPSKRDSRADMIRIASMYYPALTGADANNAPFADDCLRHENGMQTTGNPPPAKPGMGTMGAMGCAAQLKTGVMNYIVRIEPVRVMIADPETGLVFGLSHFRQPMKSDTETIVGVSDVKSIPMKFKPFDLPAAHVFKVYGGQIHEIEAMGFMMPYDSKTGWENTPDHGR